MSAESYWLREHADLPWMQHRLGSLGWEETRWVEYGERVMARAERALDYAGLAWPIRSAWECGCGGGAVAAALLRPPQGSLGTGGGEGTPDPQEPPGGRAGAVYVSDPSDLALTALRTAVPGAIVVDGEPPEQVELTTCCNVLQHVTSDQAALEIVGRLRRHCSGAGVIHTRRPIDGYPRDEAHRWCAPDAEVECMLRYVGWRVRAIEHEGDFAWWMVTT